jgi:cell division protein FtsL
VRPPQTPERRGAPAAVLTVLGRLSRHPLLERLVRSRWLIALVGFALIGIVTLQLGLLQLNAGIGRTLLRERALERENASLSIENSALASGERVEQLATHLGMAFTAPTALRFLRASYGSGVSARAASALRAPVHHPEAEATSAGASTGGEGEAASTSTSTSGEGEAASAPSTESGQGVASAESAEATGAAATASLATGAEEGAPGTGG